MSEGPMPYRDEIHEDCNAEIERLKADRQKLLAFVRHMEKQIGYEWLAREFLRDVGEVPYEF